MSVYITCSISICVSQDKEVLDYHFNYLIAYSDTLYTLIPYSIA